MSAAQAEMEAVNKTMAAQAAAASTAKNAVGDLASAASQAAAAQKALGGALDYVALRGVMAEQAMRALGTATAGDVAAAGAAAAANAALSGDLELVAAKASLAALALKAMEVQSQAQRFGMAAAPWLPADPQNRGGGSPVLFGSAVVTDALIAKVNALSAATTAAGASAIFAGRGFYGLWGVLGAQVPLFGGHGIAGIMTSVSALHLLVDGVAEFAAVVIPASIATGAWGIAAGETFTDMYQKLTNINTAARATGTYIYPITGAFNALQQAAKPSAMLLIGDGLAVIGQKASGLRGLIVGVGNALDQLGTRAATALTSKSGFSTFMTKAVSDVQLLGATVGNVFGIFGNLLHSVPGIANVLLVGVQKATSGIEAFTSSGVVQGITKVGLAFHGAAIYVGLAATAVSFGLRGALTVAGNFAEKLGTGLLATDRFGAAGVRAGSALLGMSADAAGAAAFISGPWGIAIIGGAVALGVLIDKAATAQTAMQQYGNALQSVISKSSAASGAPIATGLAQAQAKLNATAYQVAPGVYLPQAQQRGGVPYNASNIGAVQQNVELVHRLSAEEALYQQRLQSLVPTFGSVQAAQNALTASGVTMGQFLSKNASQWAQVKTAMTAAEDVYVKFGATSAQAANDVTVLGRAQSDQVVAATQLNQAEDAYIAALTGSRSAFNTYFTQMATLATAQKAAKGNLNALTTAGVAYSQAFQTQVTNAQGLADAWRMAGVTGKTLSTGIQATVQPLMAQARGSQYATAELAGLLQQAGYQGPPIWKNMAAWLTTVAHPLQTMAAVSAQATIQTALLTTAMKGQGAYIANQMITQINQAILKYGGVKTALNNYTNAIAQFGPKSAQAATAQQALIQSLIRAGTAAGDTKQQIAELITKILGIPLSRTIQIVVNALGHWSVSGGVAGYTGSASYSTTFGNTGFLGHSAAGGMIRGGRAGIDSVPILAMPGEVVIPTSMVNAGAIDHLRGQLPGFASGGLVSLGSWAQSSYDKTVANGVTGMRALVTSELQATLTSAMQAGVGKAKGGMIYDQGGWLPPGISMAMNNTGQAEQIVGPDTAAQQNSLLQSILQQLQLLNQQTETAPANVGAAVTRGFSGAARPARLGAYYSTRTAHG